MIEIQPRRTSFLIERVAGRWMVLWGLALGVALALVLLEHSLLLPWVGLAALAVSVLVLIDAHVAYRKERYVFQDRQIICRSGGVLRDRQAELNVTNITQVQQVLPWPRYRLFGVGSVVIHSAGSAQPIHLRALADPAGVYELVQTRMRANGFSLALTGLLHQERPATAAVVREVGRRITVWLGPGFGLAFGLLALAGLPSPWGVLLPALLLPLAILAFLVHLLLHALDVRGRTYSVYEDAAVYREGFLTRHHAIIPGENLSDAAWQQTLIDRVLSLYDVMISCQGGGAIAFIGLQHGPTLGQALKTLAAMPRVAPERRSAIAPISAAASQEQADGVIDERSAPVVSPDAVIAGQERPERTYQMHVGRAMAPFVLGLVLVVIGGACAMLVALAMGASLSELLGGGGVVLVVLASVGAGGLKELPAAFVTWFEFGPRSVKRRYRLLQTSEIEYTDEKLTGLVIRRGVLDRLFGTYSLHFWSIGAPAALVFAHLKMGDGAFERALQHAGISEVSPAPRCTVPSVWSPVAAVGAHLPSWLGIGMVLAALCVAAVGISAWFWIGVGVIGTWFLAHQVYEPMACRCCRMLFHRSHLEAWSGILIRRGVYARYANIRHVTTQGYPGGDVGQVVIEVAGQGSDTRIRQAFVPGLADAADRFDRWFDGQTPVGESGGAGDADTADLCFRPVLAGTLVPLVLVSVLVLPLVALLPVTLPWAVLAVRRRSYHIQARRVVARWGVYYRWQRSVLFARIDQIQHAQGMLGKLLGFGAVAVQTSGSAQTDLTANHLKEDRAFYDQLRHHYGGEPTVS